MSLLSQAYYVVYPALIALHLAVAPYTKVEESFNIQAIHDFIRHGIPFTNSSFRIKTFFDHINFPGSVPRTFVGALVTGAACDPLVRYGDLNGFEAQMAARGFLGFINAAALIAYTRSVQRRYGDNAALWYTMLQASQFHVFFYASRTLPNTFAFCLSTWALSRLLPKPGTPPAVYVSQIREAFYLLAFAAAVFRSELAIYIAILIICMAYQFGNPTNAYNFIKSFVFPGVLIGGAAGVSISVALDSHMWQSKEFFLPELSAFWFNVFPQDHQGASAWGTLPWNWYFTSAIPRLVMPPGVLLILYSLTLYPMKNTTLERLIPPLGYAAVYSILPHKETRFLFPTIPQLTLACAVPAAYLSLRRTRIAQFSTAILAALIILTGVFSHGILLPLSAQTYPGGHALAALHDYHLAYTPAQQSTSPDQPQIHVHLTNLALQTGVTRFLEQPATPPNTPLSQTPLWIYDKTEHPTNTSEFWAPFSYAIVESSFLSTLSTTSGKWKRIASIPSLRRSSPRLLTPTENRGTLILSESNKPNDGMSDLLQAMYGSSVADLYAIAHDVLREGYGVGFSITGGKWIDWGLEERLVVMKREDDVAGNKVGSGKNKRKEKGEAGRVTLEHLM